MSQLDLLDEIDQQPDPSAKRGLGGGPIMLLAGVVVFLAVIGIALVRQNQDQPTTGLAPDFTITTFDGEVFTLSEQRGKIVILNFWASWCGPCHEEAPALQRLAERYQDRVVFLGVTHVDEPDDSKAFIERYGITYANAEDPRDDITKRLYRITGVPETFVIAPDGSVAQFFFAAINETELAALFDQLLETAAT